MKTSKIIAFILALVLVLGLFAGCAPKEAADDKTDAPSKDAGETEKTEKEPSDAEETAKTLSVNSYEEIYDLLYESINRFDDVTTGVMGDSAVPEEPEADMPTDAPAADSESNKGDYSGTNVQTEGVDEGDIVKTDGKYIYVLKENRTVVILKAEVADTKEISRFDAAKGTICADSANGSYTKEENASQMYLAGDRLVVLINTYEWGETKTETGYEFTSEEKSFARIYDVSDPADPKFVTEAGQKGSVRDSRMDGDTLYLVSGYYVWDTKRDDERTYIPEIYNGDEPQLMPIDCIVIPEMWSGTAWSVITAIDTLSGEMKASHAVMGDATKVYMSRENIYIVSGSHNETKSDPYTEDQYTVTEHSSEAVTTIVKYETAGGKLDYKVTSSVPGYIESQFSLSEHDGYLRLVTTESWNNYKIYTDEKHGWSNYEHIENGTHASLFVLGEDLKIVGSVTGLGEDERVYSARFDGDIAYFVTFRETDPLFAVDLSDPTSPKVLSALKIPGFSEYLHPYGEGRLFGLGMAVDESSGWTECLKLSMFDISDPADVTEKTTLELKNFMWSPALYDHHAVLISTAKNIIAFPTDTGYLVYGYTDESGFTEKAEISLGDWSYNTRGLYIGDCLYVCSDSSVIVIDMTGFGIIKNIAI